MSLSKSVLITIIYKETSADMGTCECICVYPGKTRVFVERSGVAIKISACVVSFPLSNESISPGAIVYG